MQVEVTKKPLKYGGQLHPVGALIDMTRGHAKVFNALGQVRIREGASGDEVPEMESRPKRRYRRRDMQAE